MNENNNQVKNQSPKQIGTQAIRETISPFTVIDKEKKEITLPFVGFVGEGEKRRESYWAVQPTGRRDNDRILGRAYAVEALRFALGKEWPGLLRLVINDFPKGKKFSGIENGFLEIITDCALFGAMIYGNRMIP